jgi:hypothetical protein
MVSAGFEQHSSHLEKVERNGVDVTDFRRQAIQHPQKSLDFVFQIKWFSAFCARFSHDPFPPRLGHGYSCHG